MQLSELYVLCGDTLTAMPDRMLRMSFTWGRHLAPQSPTKHACLQDAAILAGLGTTGYALGLYPLGIGLRVSGKLLAGIGL